MKFGRTFAFSFQCAKRQVSIPEFVITGAVIAGRRTVLGCCMRPASFIKLRTDATIATPRA